MNCWEQGWDCKRRLKNAFPNDSPFLPAFSSFELRRITFISSYRGIFYRMTIRLHPSSLSLLVPSRVLWVVRPLPRWRLYRNISMGQLDEKNNFLVPIFCTHPPLVYWPACPPTTRWSDRNFLVNGRSVDKGGIPVVSKNRGLNFFLLLFGFGSIWRERE